MATLTTRRGYWILNWQDAYGRHRQNLGRLDVLPRKDAEAVLAAKRYELSTGTRLLRVGRAPAPAFGEFARDYLAWHRAEFPDSHYRVAQIVADHLLPRWEFTPLDLLSIQEAEQFKTERRLLARASTVTKELRVLQAVMNRAVALNLIPKNPVAGVKAPRILDAKPHRFYEAAELVQLYAKAAPAHGAIWKLLANTGLRRGEAQALRWAWIGEDAMRIVSSERERTKSGEWREIPLSDGAREALQTIQRKGEYVLPRIAPESLSRAFLRDVRAAELDGSLHTLRHTYISHLVRAGVPLRTVQLYAGHANYRTTEGYAYLSPGAAPAQALRLAI